jgi:NAD(P)-dependent dehydrogenase (short-subunit alcohol dehydrogenase family)
MILVVNDGGASGYTIVHLLLKQNEHVVMVDRQTKLDFLERLQDYSNFQYLSLDFYHTDLIEQLVKQITSSKKLTGFVYSAGIGGVRPLSLINTAFLHQMMNANLYAFIEWVRCISKKSRFEIGGSIVAISSVSSIKGLKSKIAYSASKAALDASVRGMAAELAERKIRVNSIQKGWVRADMQHDFIQDNMQLSKNQDADKQVLGIIENDDLARSVLFLLSNDSKFITGTQLLVDGGYTLS